MTYGDWYPTIHDQRLRHEDLLKAAENHRLARIARGQGDRTPVTSAILEAAGNVLVKLGTELKQRSGMVTTIEVTPLAAQDTAAY